MVKILNARVAEYTERKKEGVKMRWFDELTATEMSKIELYNKKIKGNKIP